MNMQQAPTAPIPSREQQSAALRPRRPIMLARGVWLALVVLTLAIFFASLPLYLAQLQTICIGPACSYLQLSAEQGGVLKEMGLSTGDYAVFVVALTLTSVVVCLVVSTLIVWRRPDDRMALLVALMLVAIGPVIDSSSISSSSSLWQVPEECLYFFTLALISLVFSLFPTGLFVPRWTRWTVVVSLTALALSTFFPDAPFTLKINSDPIGYLLFIGELGLLAIVQIYRYRHVSSPLQRQQTKWVIFGFAVPITISASGTLLYQMFPALALPSSLYPLALNVVSALLLLLVPLSFGFAMLRSRLWDIDALINRTLVYGMLTVSLALVYFGLIISLQALLGGIISQDNNAALVLSTLTIAALFHPLRTRLQALIDRRFYRHRYDSAKTLEAFSATLRREVDLSHMSEQLIAVVSETMQPAHLSLWLCQSHPPVFRERKLNQTLDPKYTTQLLSDVTSEGETP